METNFDIHLISQIFILAVVIGVGLYGITLKEDNKQSQHKDK
jgi:hypothetical protein